MFRETLNRVLKPTLRIWQNSTDVELTKLAAIISLKAKVTYTHNLDLVLSKFSCFFVSEKHFWHCNLDIFLLFTVKNCWKQLSE